MRSCGLQAPGRCRAPRLSLSSVPSPKIGERHASDNAACEANCLRPRWIGRACSRSWPRERDRLRDAARDRWPAHVYRRARAHLPARTHSHLSLLLQSRPARRLQLLFRLRPLRAGRYREPGAQARILSAGHRMAARPLWRAAAGLGAETLAVAAFGQRVPLKNVLSRLAALVSPMPPITSGV